MQTWMVQYIYYCCWFVCQYIQQSVAIQREIYMDSMVFCGKTYTVYDMDYLIVAREQLTGSNPPLRCEITLQTGYQDPYYQLEIRQEAITISDCAFKLEIYAGQSGSRSLKSLSCGSKSTGVLYTKDRYAKLVLTQSQDLFAPANDFTLRVRTWRSPDAPVVDESMYRLSAGAIIGIVLGLIVFIVFAIMLCWCYKTGRLPGMNETKGPRYYTSSRENISKSDGGSVNVAMVPDTYLTEKNGSNSPASTKKSMFDYNDPRVWNSLTGNDNAKNKTKEEEIKRPALNPPPGGKSYSTNKGGMYEKATARTVDQKQTNAAPVGSSSPGRIRGRSQYNSFKESQQGNVDLPPAERAINTGRNNAKVSDQRDVNNLSSSPGRTRRNEYEDVGNTYENFQARRPERNASNRQQGGQAKETTFGPEESDTDVKRPSSGVFDVNPDDEGYMYDYDHVKKLSNGKNEGNKKNANATMGSEASIIDLLKTELAKRKSLKEKQQNENNGVEKEDSLKRKNKKDSFRDKEAPGGPKGKSGGQAEFNELNLDSLESDAKYRSIDQESEIGASEVIDNPLLRGTNSAIRASVTELRPRTEESPKSKKKHRKKSENKPKSSSNQPVTGAPNSTGKNKQDQEDLSDPYTSGSMPPSYPPKEDIPLPPEAMAPIFTTDDSAMQHYYPYQPDQYGGYQPPVGFPVVGYDAYGNPVYNYGNQPPGVPPTMPYAQAGQAAWYVQQTPTNNGPVTKAAFIMTTTPSHSAHDNIEAYHPHQGTYDPNYGGQYGYNAGDISHPGMPGYTSTPYNPTQQSPHGLQQLSFNTARQLQAGVEDPAFLSPSKSSTGRGHHHYTPKPIYAAETPERENADFYTHSKYREPDRIPGSPVPPPVIHEGPKRHMSIRDQITLSHGADEYEI
ncbi:hypothetical protein KUTeg_020145 [Tegillarca granosa]|uniref:CUB domain-containing protein n=1 Tax=Tegillarca granosa TaxID=220873 RepID=A0ABQ9E6Z0_TEGGR|nr:hypothetical protein KUTeg_020145 [Tegillarca granosa]